MTGKQGRCRLLISLVLLAACTCASAAGPARLKVAVYSNAPKVFLDEQGKPAGIFIDLLHHIAQAENWQIDYVECQWQACLDGVQNGKIDLLPDVAFSDERHAALDFHPTPALHSWSQVYRHPKVEIKSILDLQGRRVALVAGTIQQPFVESMSHSFGLQLIVVPAATTDQAFEFVTQGKADAVVANKYTGDAQMARYQLLDTSIMFQPNTLYFGARKGAQQAALAAIERHLRAWQADRGSVYFATLRRWQAPDGAAPIPLAVWWSITGIVFLLVSTLCVAAWLRRQVEVRTRDWRNSERKLATILDSVDSLIYIKDASYRYDYVNGAVCRRLGRSGAEILGKTDEQLFPNTTTTLLREQDRRVIEQAERVVAEESMGEDIFLSTKIPLCRDDGSVYALCGISTDISERKRVEDSLRVAATVFQSQEAMFVMSTDRRVLNINHAFAAMSGYAPDDIIGQTVLPVALAPDGPDARGFIWENVARSGQWRAEVWTRRKNGERYPAWLTVTAVRDAQGVTTNYVATQTDITGQKLAQDEIVQLAYYDTLTRLPNRRLLLDRLQHGLSLHQRSKLGGALLFLDLDNFKDLNDTRGHEIGDQLLQQVAQRLQRASRESDTVARLGGDEFVILLEGIGGTEPEAHAHAGATGAKILDLVRQPFMIDDSAHHASCSIGIALYPEQNLKANDLMKRADLAMYQAKKEGRNTVRFFHDDMESAVSARIALERDIRAAISQSQFVLHYQPQVDGQGVYIGAEALVRWQHPERGLVPPMAFIGIAEESGLILPLGDWVLRTACTELAAWARSPATAHLTLAVNVSAHQFRQCGFVAATLATLALTGAPASRLKLELTESVLIEQVEDTIAKMRQLKEHGVTFALDDFGTGFSSLSYLKNLPLDQLKIDRSFVRDLLIDPNDAAIARSIVALANALGLGIIAEGVETEEQRAFLAEIGCEACQGYLFSKPVEALRFRQLVLGAPVQLLS